MTDSALVFVPGIHFLPSVALRLLVPVILATALLTATGGCAGKAEFDGAEALKHVERQCAFGPRVPGTKAHDACRDWFVAELKKICDTVQVQHFEYQLNVSPAEWRSKLRLPARFTAPPSTKLPMDNIIAVIKGTDGKDPSLLLCAHWDSRPTADLERRAENRVKAIAGANDGASGVAVLLELARVFKAKRPTQGVIIVLFDGEDYGPDTKDMFIGSKYYAQNPLPVKPKEGILLDMVGDADLEITRESWSVDANRALCDTVFKTAEGLGYSRQFRNQIGIMIEDDHLPLIRAGIPTINLIDFTYPYWHTLADTPDKCSAASLSAVGETVAAVVYARSSNP